MKLILTCAALTIAASGATAQQLTGGSVGISYEDFPDVDDVAMTTFAGSGEVALGNNIAVAGDVVLRSFEDFDENLTAITLHGIYRINPDVSVGVFVGRETIDNFEADNYGGEIAFNSGPMEAQAYIGATEIEDTDVTLLGVSAGYGLGNGFSAIGAYDRLNIDAMGDITTSTIEIGGEYAFGNGAEVFANFGQLSFDIGSSNESENYFNIGANFHFGAQGDTTFDSRGFFENFPVFGL